ncbi:MAG: bifunctional adenosylcobinamide kinase/adenosylcobinamide-phosphate guanylyltransferase [Chlorobiales bacterium]|nr:bifunctional adenosylcobinamide kinase/adenosylcobinamide-phosphate guanylyltransferase [Chlorobiales bacterium]
MIYYVSGGQRSGKSRYAQELALKLSDCPVYLATSRVWDDDHHARIDRHKKDRGDKWDTIEEEKFISKHDLSGRVVVVDCVTLWLTNFFTDAGFDAEKALVEAKHEFDAFSCQNMTGIIISNEIGMGVIAESNSVRKFVDLQGWMNQYIAQRADEAVFMVSGLPLRVKTRSIT